jgi:hypothetical protein
MVKSTCSIVVGRDDDLYNLIVEKIESVDPTTSSVNDLYIYTNDALRFTVDLWELIGKYIDKFKIETIELTGFDLENFNKENTIDCHSKFCQIYLDKCQNISTFLKNVCKNTIFIKDCSLKFLTITNCEYVHIDRKIKNSKSLSDCYMHTHKHSIAKLIHFNTTLKHVRIRGAPVTPCVFDYDEDYKAVTLINSKIRRNKILPSYLKSVSVSLILSTQDLYKNKLITQRIPKQILMMIIDHVKMYTVAENTLMLYDDGSESKEFKKDCNIKIIKEIYPNKMINRVAVLGMEEMDCIDELSQLKESKIILPTFTIDQQYGRNKYICTIVSGLFNLLRASYFTKTKTIRMIGLDFKYFDAYKPMGHYSQEPYAEMTGYIEGSSYRVNHNKFPTLLLEKIIFIDCKSSDNVISFIIELLNKTPHKIKFTLIEGVLNTFNLSPNLIMTINHNKKTISVKSYDSPKLIEPIVIY